MLHRIAIASGCGARIRKLARCVAGYRTRVGREASVRAVDAACMRTAAAAARAVSSAVIGAARCVGSAVLRPGESGGAAEGKHGDGCCEHALAQGATYGCRGRGESGGDRGGERAGIHTISLVVLGHFQRTAAWR